jgi:hypothetical protein
LVLKKENCVSQISKLEVLGFPNLSQLEKQYFENIFNILTLLSIDERVINLAIKLRQKFKIKSNDSIIASTAMLHNLVVYTRNVDDFKNIIGLTIVNPIL